METREAPPAKPRGRPRKSSEASPAKAPAKPAGPPAKRKIRAAAPRYSSIGSYADSSDSEDGGARRKKPKKKKKKRANPMAGLEGFVMPKLKKT